MLRRLRHRIRRFLRIAPRCSRCWDALEYGHPGLAEDGEPVCFLCHIAAKRVEPKE